MINSVADFFRQNKPKSKQVILSLDLDNTLIIRDKGGNYINPKVKSLLIKLMDRYGVVVVPNTGRELVGFAAFQRQALPLKNGILGSGSLVIRNNRKYFNKRSQISKKILVLLCSLVQKGRLPFIDLSGMFGRKIFYHPGALPIKGLFFSQNPKEWFLKLPPTLPIKKYKGEDLDTVFRAEFPVSPEHRDLFGNLFDKKSQALFSLGSLAGIKTEDLNDYSIKNKLFFNEKYIKNYVFARLEKKTNFINKGIGLKNWLNKSGLTRKASLIIHVGDKDSGLIDDTIIKESVPEAKIVMVGQRSQLGNPQVDLYLRGPVEDELLIFLKSLHDNLK
ncbi:MAG: hypothetical protein Q7K35_04530 [bacterium]|nr:hypothetical protein [bacterium]